ncbi:unnamed protein product [Anisakis simplex]|uniref:Trigger_N domain-containing protein n=1 Tax=Anisakis simplex TaxID=6269 RepID=A0A0M3J4F3_ANISI|nr:unnamed protein product [Anisakis simplex]
MSPKPKRSVGCNPDALIVELVTKLPFGTPESNKNTARMIRAKILKLIAHKNVQTENYGEFDVTETSHNDFLNVQFTFVDSVHKCDDFKHFAQSSAKEIAEIGKVIVTCGCMEPIEFE